MEQISWAEFEKIELRSGTIINAEDFPEAKIPACKVTVDFGEYGIKKSSARITALYRKEELIGKQVIGVINFPKKKIGPFESEVLVCGFYREDGAVVLATPDKKIANGLKLA